MTRVNLLVSDSVPDLKVTMMAVTLQTLGSSNLNN